jgi:hypothetical protein
VSLQGKILHKIGKQIDSAKDLVKHEKVKSQASEDKS